MKLSGQIKPISYLKAHAAEIVRHLTERGEPLVITQNGEAKVVMQDIESYEQTQETMALLKIPCLGNRQIEKQCKTLSESPQRGAHPKELLSLGIREYREVFFKPYRIIHRILNDTAYVLLIANGRRDLQTLLERRLLGAWHLPLLHQFFLYSIDVCRLTPNAEAERLLDTGSCLLLPTADRYRKVLRTLSDNGHFQSFTRWFRWIRNFVSIQEVTSHRGLDREVDVLGYIANGIGNQHAVDLRNDDANYLSSFV